jgi:hypothetical protein
MRLIEVRAAWGGQGGCFLTTAAMHLIEMSHRSYASIAYPHYIEHAMHVLGGYIPSYLDLITQTSVPPTPFLSTGRSPT